MELANQQRERILKVTAFVVPFVIIGGLLTLSSGNGKIGNLELWWGLPYLVAIGLGVIPLLLSKADFPHGKGISVAVYAASMFILLLLFSLSVSCWYFQECL